MATSFIDLTVDLPPLQWKAARIAARKRGNRKGKGITQPTQEEE
jgi:hypothetical protein